MSLFIAGLAFGEESPLTEAKLGILAASVVAGVAGWLVLRTASPKTGRARAGPTAARVAD